MSSWNAKETIANCFKKSNISHSNEQTAATNAGDSFKSLEKELDNLQQLDQSALQDKLSPESFNGLDSEYITSASHTSDADILTKDIPDSIDDRDDDINDINISISHHY